jgi:hydroxymethylpyrimidine/phosphomethylpyrimidine kinase
VLSAAITARLARGEDLLTAVRGAKRFVTRAIETSPELGQGCGPVNLHVQADGNANR